MNFINPPSNPPQNVTHKTFYSQTLHNEIGYNIYLPPCYNTCGEKYPVVYHLHGWTGNESSEIWPLETICKSRQTITVFVNVISSEAEYLDALFQIESILINELIPHIDGQYRTCESKSISGFSMGGNMAFYVAAKHSDLFKAVTSYAGTYHHLYQKGSQTVDAAAEKAVELYTEMIQENRHLEENNILCILQQNADDIRNRLSIALHIGTADILLCDNEIMHLHLNALHIPHEYKKYNEIGHDLANIV